MQLSRRGLLGAASAVALSSCATSQAASSDALGADDGVGIATRIRNGEITAAEATEAAIARAERLNPTLNFTATKAYDYARTRAAAPLTGPLAGLPTFVKDLNDLAGVKTMQGSRAFRDNVARTNDRYVEAMLAAGLVPIGKSTTPEFGFTATTEPLVTGATRNPWNTDRIAGGSSGGAGAAVAAGVVPVAHASDGGGSIRIPASINGLVGLKPSRGRLQGAPEAAPVSIGVDGCVSRTVRDTAAWLAATQRTGADQVFAPIPVISGPSTQRLRIALTIDSYNQAADPAVRTATEQVAQLCRELGHTVQETELPFDAAAFEDAFILYWAAGALGVREDFRRNRAGTPLEELLEPLSLQLAAHAERRGQEAVGQAIAKLVASEAEYAAMFANVDVWLTPTLAKPPLRIGEIAPTLPWEEGFARVLQYVKYTPLSNASGGCAISLPLSMTADNLPIGAHFMAAKGEEARLLHLAYELENARPWAQLKPPNWAG